MKKGAESTRRQSPTELMLNRPIRTRLDLMKRNRTTEINEKSNAHHVKSENPKLVIRFKLGHTATQV
jgi:hypothetical protein